jgi:hypothetical protein
MSSQGAIGKHSIEGDASNWIQSLKREKTYTGLNGQTGSARSDIVQSNQIRIDYNLGVAGCTGTASFPKLTTGGSC